jgi:LysR family hydrogen peroxide-inducible transcriptional activator
VDLRQLHYFAAVAEAANFTRAAGKCRVSQPSLSQQIRALEEELGEPLFNRHPRRVELTEAGRVAYQHAKGLLSGARNLRAAFDKRQKLQQGAVTVGIIPTIAPYLLPSVLGIFLKDYPRVSVQIREAQTSKLISMLASGDIDLAIASDIGPAEKKRWSITVRELFKEPLLLAVPDSHPLATLRSIPSVADVPKDELIMLSEGHCLGERVLKLCRVNRDVARLECGQLESLESLVAAGLGIGFVPKMAVQEKKSPGITYCQFRNPEPTRVISIVRRRGQQLSKPAEKLLEYISDQPKDRQ